MVGNWTSAFVTILSDLAVTLTKLPPQLLTNNSVVSNGSFILRPENATSDGSVFGVRRDDLPWEEHSASSVKGLAEQMKKQGGLGDDLEDRRGFVTALIRSWYALLPLLVFTLMSTSLILRRSCSWLWWKRRTYWRGRGPQRAVLPL